MRLWRRRRQAAAGWPPERAGAPPEVSAFTRALIAAADPARREEAAALAEQARREAAGTGTEALVEAALATTAAQAVAGPDPVTAAGSPEAARLDQVIRDAVPDAWIPDPTVQAAAFRALAPAAGRLGDKHARQAAVLVRVDRLEDAVVAVRAALAAFPGQAEVDDGCLAYAALLAARAAVEGERFEEAYRLATQALAAFGRGAPLPPVCVVDQVAAYAIRAEVARATGRAREAGDARARAVDLLRTTRLPDLPEGSMPADWGLPIVSAETTAALREWAEAPW